MTALIAAGYEVFAVNPMSVARCRQRHSTSGAKSDQADAHLLAEIVRLDRAHHRPVVGDSPQAEAVKLVARAHQSLVWIGSGMCCGCARRCGSTVRRSCRPSTTLAAPEALELLAKAPDPQRAARLSRAQIAAVLTRANRKDVAGRSARIQQILRTPQLHQPTAVTSAFAAVVTSQARIIATLEDQIGELGQVVGDHFGRHRDAEIYISQPVSVLSRGPGPRRVWR